jgi:sec-independent protein translocase protein TatA
VPPELAGWNLCLLERVKANEMQQIGAPELILIVVIVLVLFGPGRVSKVAGELGSGIRAFKEGLKGEGEQKTSPGPESNSENPENEDSNQLHGS